MLGVTDIWTYVLGTVAIVLLPGPNTLLVLSTAARHGVGAGYRTAAGVFLGDWLLMLGAAAGVASLLRAYPPVFLVIKGGGAVYLCYVGVGLAVRAWRRRAEPSSAGEASAAGPPSPPSPATGPTPARRPFRRGLLVSLVNPKAILFFVSFFIQFIDPNYPHPAQSFLVLALILQACSAVYLSGLILGGNYLAAQFRRRRRLARGLSTGVGALFIGFGVRLALASLSS